MGCCGSRPISIGALVAAADALPPDTRAGRIARQRLAYTIVAAKAAQAGNQRAYAKAMRGLGELATGTPAPTFHGDVSAARARIASSVTAASSGPSLAQLGAQIGAVVNMLATVAQLASSIAAAAGGDATAVAVANTVVSWVRAIVNGTTPTIPTLDATTLAGFVEFCRVGQPVKAAVDAGLTLAIAPFAGNVTSATLAGRTPNPSDVTAVAVLTSIMTRLDAMFDGICAAVGTQAGAQTQTCADGSVIPSDRTCATDAQCRAEDPNSIARGAGCACANGLLDPARPYAGCAPVSGTRRFPRPGDVRPSTLPLIPLNQPSTSGGGSLLLPAAAAALAVKFLFF